ncbi:MAG: type I phosphomannose isomerase catalytic subunit [Candidatus Hydrogenedentota bacterium]
MAAEKWDILHFEERYYERVWGGRKLRTIYGKDVRGDVPIGEAWLISDHPGDESIISQGAFKGKTLQDLLETDAKALLGTKARPTPAGRFPLLLKILDAAQHLSVQVHPDDHCAERLGESDVGKTEMWYVLQAEPGSELICGLDPDVNRETLANAIQDGSIEQLMKRFPVKKGSTAFVAAGTVHAIGGGVVLAEIQQNSDLTYRLYDWGRVGTDGKPRELHIEKGLEAIHFGSHHGGEAKPLACAGDGTAERSIVAACRHFAADHVACRGYHEKHTRADSFHILLAMSGPLAVSVGQKTHTIDVAEAVLIPGQHEQYTVEGLGEFLDYYVPHLEVDIIEPLLAAGHSRDAITLLGGDREHSDLRMT